MAAQFPDRTSFADVNHDPPSATTLGSASHSAALSAPMPPVGQNLIRGNGLMTFFKKLFNRPLSSAALLRQSEKNIKNPPLPKEWRDLAASLVGKSGGSNLDFWRTDYKST